MIVVKSASDLSPAELMEAVVLYVLREHGKVEARRLSKSSDRERSVRFVVAPAGGEAVQIEAHAASSERGQPLPASIALFGLESRPSPLQRELAELLASRYDGMVWEPDRRETERLRLPGADDMRDRRRGIRREAPGVDAVTQQGLKQVRDLSHGGLSFFASQALEIGSLLPIELVLAESGEQIELLIRVRWQTSQRDDGGYPTGGQIVALRQEDRMALESYLDSGAA